MLRIKWEEDHIFMELNDVKGNPFEKGRYNQYDGHYPEDFNGYKK